MQDNQTSAVALKRLCRRRSRALTSVRERRDVKQEPT
jgi:hypothetical protein